MEPNFTFLNTPKIENNESNNVQKSSMSWLDKDLPKVSNWSKSPQNQTTKIKTTKKILISEWLKHPQKRLVVIYTFQIIACLLLALFTLALLYIFNPPLTQSNGKQSATGVAVFTVVVFVMAFIIAECIRWIKY